MIYDDFEIWCLKRLISANPRLAIQTVTQLFSSPTWALAGQCSLVLTLYAHDVQVANGKVHLSVKRVKMINLMVRLFIFGYAVCVDPKAVAVKYVDGHPCEDAGMR